MKQELVKKRIHACLATSISEYFKTIGVPAIYGPPVAFTLIQAVVGKTVFFRTKKGFVFLSGYRFLIGAPGIGKSMAVDFIAKCLTEAKIGVPIAPSSITRASLMDDLADTDCRRAWGRDAQEQVSTILINSSEYGVFIGVKPGDDLYRTMCELFDCRNYKETRRSQKNDLEIKNPYVNMITGTQPEHFSQHFPREAWKAGYASRCDFYYSEDLTDDAVYYLDYNEAEAVSENMQEDEFIKTIAHDLQCMLADIQNENGVRKPGKQIYMSAEAQARFEHWHMVERRATEFTHPWLIDYNARRTFRLRRDAALFCLCRGDTNYVIQASDFEHAIALHIEQDRGLTILTDKIMTSDNGDILSMVHQWAVRVFMDTKNKPLPRGMVTEFIMHKVKTHEVAPILRHLIEHEILIEVKTAPSGIGNSVVNLTVPMLKPNLNWLPLGKNR